MVGIISCPSPSITNHLWKGRGQRHVTNFRILHPMKYFQNSYSYRLHVLCTVWPREVLTFRWPTAVSGRGRVTWPILEFHSPWNISGPSSKFVRLQAISSVNFRTTKVPKRGVTMVTSSISEFYTPLNFSGMPKDRIVKFCAWVGPRSACRDDEMSPRWACSRSRDALIFGKKVLISRKRWKIQIYLQWKTNRKSYMAYQVAATALTCMTFKVIHRL